MEIVILNEDKPRTFICLRRELKFSLRREVNVLLPAPHETGIALFTKILWAQFQTKKTRAFTQTIKLITRRAQKIPMIGRRCVVEVFTCRGRIPNMFWQIGRWVFKLHTSCARAE